MRDQPRKKLIEVALPLEAINRESAREKSIRHGHPSTLHLWWARRPLAACRAVLFASIVDDPSSRPDEFPTDEAQEAERQRLFRIVEELVRWENSNNETVLEAARAEIMKATNGNPPPVLDPFCGGGSIPLEAQRLGLEAHASDLNPVAVLITKALIEIPPKFASEPPVNPESRAKLGHGGTWRGAQGLAEDVRYYGKWMRNEAFTRIGHLYPKANLPDGTNATVIAWLWARTVTCPNPACGAEIPLLGSLELSRRPGRRVSLAPVIDASARRVEFQIRSGPPDDIAAWHGRGANFRCFVCDEWAEERAVREQFVKGSTGARLVSTVVQIGRTREYLPASADYSSEVSPSHGPDSVDAEMDTTTPNLVSGRGYGVRRWSELFTERQLSYLGTLVDCLEEVSREVVRDGGTPPYAAAIKTYLAFGISKTADYNSSFVLWSPSRDQAKTTFARQALPMVWDFAEVNPFAAAAGDFAVSTNGIAEAVAGVPADARAGTAVQLDATQALVGTMGTVATDPPYYDNIGYAELSDFFYVWLRPGLEDIYPDVFATLSTPKSQELIAGSYRFEGDRDAARDFFEKGLRSAFRNMRELQVADYPLTLFYAFKQAETLDGSVASTGWETMLTGLLESQFCVTGTWPMRTERAGRTVALRAGALASSILLVCRPRPEDASIATRREFVNVLRAELPNALRTLQRENIAPVDLAQAAIGPGMAVFSRYAKVLEADGSPMAVRAALSLINEALDEILAEQEGDFDADTRFAITWFDQWGTAEGPFGEADVLARAKNTSVRGLGEAGVLISRANKARLLGRDEMPDDWDPVTDRRATAWEATQHLTRRLETVGEAAAAQLLRRLGGDYGAQARELAYRLYTICERKGWAQDALGYNALVVAWPEIVRLANEPPPTQQGLSI
jgi:putative DNA methylase